MVKDVTYHLMIVSMTVTLATHWTSSDDLQPHITSSCSQFTERTTTGKREHMGHLGEDSWSSRSCENSKDKSFLDGQYCKLHSASEAVGDCITELQLKSSYSSVWCHSSPESSLRCHFRNLFYNAKFREFVFVLSPESILYGIKTLKELEGLYLSSVIGHNAFQMQLSVVPWSSAVRTGSVEVIEGKTLMMGRFKPDNILHVFHDDLLPLYFTMRELCSDMELCKDSLNVIITDDNYEGDYWNLYRMFSSNIRKLSELVPDDSVQYCFQEAYIGLNKMSVWYQYGFGKAQGPVVNEKFLGVHLRQFSDYVRKSLNVRKSSKMRSGILMSRKSNRKILNEVELSEAIQDIFASRRESAEIVMKVLSLEENNHQNMVAELSDAALLIGVHGSALILGMFLPPGSVLVEIWPYGVDPSAATVFKTMCELKGFGVTYVPWVNRHFHNTLYHPEYPPFYGGLTHLPSEEQNEIISRLHQDKINSLECCDNTEWLFRIYQDTKVDIGSFIDHKSDTILDLVLNGLEKAKLTLDFRTEKEFETMTYQLYPGKVLSLNCHLEKVEEGFAKLYIDWRKPWNIQDLRCDDLEYEIIMQSDSENEYVRYEIQDHIFLKKFNMNVDTIRIWVTCFCNSLEGSTVYKICK